MGRKDVSVTRDKLGKPKALLSGRALEIAQELGVVEVALSITLTGDLAVANAIAITEDARPKPKEEKVNTKKRVAQTFKEARSVLDELEQLQNSALTEHLGDASQDNYVKFEKRGFKVVGIFDINPVLKGISIRGNEIRMMDELPEFLRENDVQIATLTLPKAYAEETANLLVENGIKAIWNFAHLDLAVPEDVIVENVHLSESLMRLSYNLNRYNTEHKKE